MKKGYQVIATRPICVDFEDGRVVSYRPQMRFHADHRNRSVNRALRRHEVRELSAFEAVPVLPVKLGTPPDQAAILKARADITRRKKIARARVEREKREAIRTKEAAIRSTRPGVPLDRMNVPPTKTRTEKTDAKAKTRAPKRRTTGGAEG